nr:MAG TPA: DNA-packaging protein small subunit [Bacteriophage sp.]
MATGKKIKTEEHLKKIKEVNKEHREKKIREKEKLINQIQTTSKEQLLPTLKSKTNELTNYIVDLLKNKGEEKVNNIQIMSLIAQRSMLEVANVGNITYTPQEIMLGFNLYLDMINKINEIKKFPPTVESFSIFMGISRTTYNNWLVDPDKREVMDYIHSYLLGVLATGGLIGEVREISAMYLQKTMGKVEAQQPIVVKHEKVIDVDDINRQLEALKRGNVIDAEFEEVEKD